MADPTQPCECSPYLNICCCGPQNGISVVQPACQNLQDGRVVNNPAFDPNLNKSFWTYKFLTDCGSSTRAISNLGIPICESIIAENIVLSEKIDGCGSYVPIPFTLTKDDPNLGPAPQGFQYVKVETNNRYGKGVSVEYRLEIVGDYPVAVQPIKVKAATVIYTFNCDNCFKVPDCNPQGKLAVNKKCGYTIVNNQVVLNYHIEVDNIGNVELLNVQFQDNIFITTQLSLGSIVVIPVTLTVNTSVPGEVIISGNLGTISAGGKVTITYTIPIASVSMPGVYMINNTATVSASGTKDTASCNTALNVVQLRADKCCSIENETGVYTLTISSLGDSPNIVVDIYDHMEIPAGITIKFLNLSGCEGYFSGTTNPIPTNTDIHSPVDFDFICRNALIPTGGSYVKVGRYILVSSSVIGTTTIQNSIVSVVPVNPEAQIFLGIQNIPVSANIDIELVQICRNSCQ